MLCLLGRYRCSFSNTDEVIVCFDIAGPQGVTGATNTGPIGSTGPEKEIQGQLDQLVVQGPQGIQGVQE